MMKIFGVVQLGFIIILLSSSVLWANPMDDAASCGRDASNYLSHYKFDRKYHRSMYLVHHNHWLNVCFLVVHLSRNYRGKDEEPGYQKPAFIEIFDVRGYSNNGTFLANYEAPFAIEQCKVLDQSCDSLESFNKLVNSLILEVGNPH